MKKEKVLAALLGATVGFVLAVVLLLQRSQPLPQKKVEPKKSLKPSPTVSPITGIQLLSPSDRAIVKEDNIKLSFKVPKDSLVVVVSPAFEKAFFAKKEEVEVEVKLALGENRIKIYSYPTNPALVNLEKEVVVYYLKSEI